MLLLERILQQVDDPALFQASSKLLSRLDADSESIRVNLHCSNGQTFENAAVQSRQDDSLQVRLSFLSALGVDLEHLYLQLPSGGFAKVSLDENAAMTVHENQLHQHGNLVLVSQAAALPEFLK